MLDINYIRENKDLVEKTTKAKKKNPQLVGQVLDLDRKHKKLLVQVESLRSERNLAAKAKDIQQGKRLKTQLKTLEPKLHTAEAQLLSKLKEIPNTIAHDVPIGPDESANVVLRTWSEPIKFDFKPKDHMQLGEALDIIDTKTAAKVVGARFAYLKGDAALLEFALIQFSMSILTNHDTLTQIANSIKPNYNSKPFTPVIPPAMIRPQVYDQMDRLNPKEERFHIPSDDLYLIGSAEHTLGPLHIDETIPEKELPIRYVGFSTNFRREAGSYGKDTKGILRVHQFDKIEMETFTTPQDSLTEQEFLVAIQQYALKQLNLPHQVVAICTGDLSKPDFRQIDIETWLPGQGKYRETNTSDLMTDYQARRLNIRVKYKDGTKQFVHMNDATFFAIGRTLIAILENYQQIDGSVRIPKVLQPYLNKEVINAK